MMSDESLCLAFIVKFWLKFVFQFLDRWEAGFEIFGERFGELIFGDANGFGDVAEGVVGDELVF